MKTCVGLSILVLGVTLLNPSAKAWENHALYSYVALSQMNEIVDSTEISAESIDSFLREEQNGLIELLKDEEAWARTNVPNYPPRPDTLSFHGSDKPSELRHAFLSAIRVNPQIPLPLF